MNTPTGNTQKKHHRNRKHRNGWFKFAFVPSRAALKNRDSTYPSTNKTQKVRGGVPVYPCHATAATQSSESTRSPQVMPPPTKVYLPAAPRKGHESWTYERHALPRPFGCRRQA